MSKAKRKKKFAAQKEAVSSAWPKQFAAQQKAADTILTNRDLKQNPLTAAEIMALPRNQRPPRSEWPNSGVGDNPRPYSRRRDSGTVYSHSGGSGSGFFGIMGFLLLWAVCSLVLYGVYTSLGMASPYSITVAIISGLFGAMAIRAGGAGIDVTHWW